MNCLSQKNLVDYAYPPIAQLVEQIPLKDKVVGSNPTGRTEIDKRSKIKNDKKQE